MTKQNRWLFEFVPKINGIRHRLKWLLTCIRPTSYDLTSFSNMRRPKQKVDTILHSLGKPSLAATLLALTTPLVASVNVNNPVNQSTVTSPVHYSATATTTTCSKGIGSLGVYVDNKLIYVAKGAELNTSLPLATGKHATVVEAWDHCGGATYTRLAITVVAGTPPTTAATPTFSLAAGTYTSAQTVALSDATTGATIYYTTNGAGPTTSSTEYLSPIRGDRSDCCCSRLFKQRNGQSRLHHQAVVFRSIGPFKCNQGYWAPGALQLEV
jgi:hypothetical protein